MAHVRLGNCELSARLRPYLNRDYELSLRWGPIPHAAPFEGPWLHGVTVVGRFVPRLEWIGDTRYALSARIAFMLSEWKPRATAW